MVLELLTLFLTAFWLILPAYFANSSAVFTGGRYPIDRGKTFRGKRILGDGKTWDGLAGGTIIGTLTGVFLQTIRGFFAPAGLTLPDYGQGEAVVLVPFSLALGALLGDMAKSFLKRQVGKERGAPWPVFDQFDFIVGALGLTYVVSELVLQNSWFGLNFKPEIVVIIFLVTPIIHLGANVAGYKMGKKEVPW